MLDMIRKKQKSVIIQIVFWTIIAAFVGTIFLVWGKGDQGGEDNQMAVMVNGTRIDLANYRQAYENLTEFYRELYGRQFTPELEKRLRLKHQTFQTLVDQELLLQEGKRLGIRIPQEELVASIARVEAFQIDGQFDKDRYIKALASRRLTPEQFEKGREEQMIVEQVRKRFNEGVAISESEVEEAYRLQEEKIELDFLRFSPNQFEQQVVVEEAALAAFYAERQEEFRIPEKIVLGYLEFDPAVFRSQIVISAEDLEKYYHRHLDLFEIEEKVKVAHILFRIPPDSDAAARDKIRAKAEETLKKIQAGEPFAKLAKRMSDDTASAARGGELGFFPRGAMPQRLEQAAFSLAVGAVSETILSDAGYHILKKLEHVEPGLKPLEAVKGEVEARLSGEKTRELAFEKAMDAYNIHRKEGNLESAAKSVGLEIQNTPPFARGEPAGKLGLLPESVERAFTLEDGKLARPVALSDKVILFAVKERHASRVPELTEVRDAVEKAFRRKKAAELAQTRAGELLAELRQGKPLAEVAQQRQLETSNTGLFSRRSEPFIPRIGNVDSAFPLAFQLTPEKPLLDQTVAVQEDVVLMVLANTQPADLTHFTPEQRETLRNIALAKKQREHMAKKLTELNEQAKIVISPTLQKILEEG
ncbi:MAG: SurA N-terminal domain-containing protein [Deltaproteobacteria bacterium]|nr:SurA N-terminal domain-containing protein [Deltaproteobacteria bacterium]